jgi:RHS repeat-associated protein
LHNHKPCHFPSPFSWILYADKQSRFSTGIDNILNVMEGAGISISTGGVTNFDDPCQYAQAIISQAGSINSQVANAACGGTVAPPRPCPVIDGLTAALNNVIHNLKNAGSFTLTGAQVPISVRNAGIPQVGGIRLKDGSISIATIPCMDSLYLPSLSTPSGSLMPSSVCCIRNISCPQNTNCSFDIQISYSNGATRTLRVVTKCDFLSGCGETAVHACSQPTAYMAPVKDYLNDVFNFSTANNSLPSAGQLTGLLPAIFRGDQSWHIQNTALAASGNFVVNLTYNNPEGQSKSCNITLQNNTAIGNWSNVKHVISIAPDMTVATSGITNGFILKVLSGSSVNSLATVTIRGSSSCWPMNQCSPEVTLCDSFQAMPPYPQVNNCVQGLLATANSNASIRYNAWRDSMVADLLKQYNARCLEAIETFNMKYTDRQYHYTLYYYDQAGNLVKTVPPAGVKLLSHTEALQVAASRLTAYLPAVLPQHFKHTVYRYNTLNELVWQKTPDAGESNFYYDKLGRIGASQNAQQKLTNLFSYTKYDPLGRPVEAGKFPSTALAVKTNLAAGNLAAWTNFINGRPGRTEIILTQYDQSYTPAVSQKFGTAGQRNLRKRIASVFNFSSVPHLLLRKYIHATHYSYDIEGNVSKLIQDYPNGIIKDKTIDYDYDLQSGKVNQVTYQAGFTDQFIHRYSYDAANRLTQVKTSTDGLIWETDAEYKYYRHGPLARTELGTDKVQGLDYMYTLQGWIKAVNGTTSTAATDMGQDGIVNPVPGTPQVQIRTITINGITVYVYITPLILGSNFNGPGYGAMHNPVARDAFGYVLEYYNNDYSAIQGNSCLNDMQQQTGVVRPLYNGNISRMYTQIQSLGNNGYNYIYDQLNRIASAHAWNINSSGAMSLLANNAYSNSFTYDADGNIMGQQRNGTTSVPAMDKMTYMYYDAANGTYDPAIAIPANATNRLAYVKDGIPAGNYTEDIDNQNPNNYRYDLIGNLVRDNAEHISQISWNLQNKIVRIIKSTGPSLSFEYDAFGNRVMKQVTGGTPAQNTKTFYVRDAQGNTMAVYTYNIPPAGSSKLYWGEAHIYGSSRLGMYTPAKLIPVGNTPASGPYYIASRGYKQYELSNHLGNVLATISDRKIPVAGSAALIYTADLLSGSDYYVFGMGMVGRSLPNGNYRFDFNGKEKDDEIKGIGNSLDFKARIYDPRLGKFLSTDPSFRRYPSWSPYLFAGNSPIRFIDILGKGPGDVVVAFGGADIFGIGDKGRAPILISIIEKAILNKEGGKAQSFVSSYISTDLNCTQSLDIATQAAYDFVKENYNKVNGKDVEGGKVVIEGYSFGGVLANHLTSRLVTDGIKVDFLVTVDAAAGFQTNQVVRVVESEVNLNVFQRNASSVRSHGEPNVGLTEKNKVFNVDATSGTQHGDIDDKAEIGVATQIIKNLKRPEEKSKPSGPKRRISQN